MVAQIPLSTPSLPIHDGLEVKQYEKIEIQIEEKKPIEPLKALGSPVSPPKVSGDKYTWLRQSGIPEADWTYVESIIQKESGWNPNAINARSGACGLPQSLPCSKLGADWSNPVVALRWADNYAKQRYGSWSSAYTFHQSHNWW